MPAPQRTRIENAALVLTLLFGIVWLTVGVVALPDSDPTSAPTSAHAAVSLMAAVPAIIGAAWALAVGRGRRLAMGVGMGLALAVVVSFQLTPLTFVTPLAVLILLSADSISSEPAAVSS